MELCKRRMLSAVVALVLGLCLDLSLVCASGEAHVHTHHCSHGHDDHDHHGHGHQGQSLVGSKLLPEELAEEEDMKLYGFGFQHDHDHSHGHEHFGALQLSVTGLWIHSLGCSLLVSMASLICLIILPVIFVQGKPSKAIVDSLALFGAGAMLGDAFLHQLPHAFGGGHSHDDHVGHDHHDHSEHEHSHAHSLEDLSVGIAVLVGIVLFLLVEKMVRYVEEHSGGTNALGHGHHHHHHSKKLKDDNDFHDDLTSESSAGKDGRKPNVSSEGKVESEVLNDSLKENSHHDSQLRKRNTDTGDRDNKQDVHAADDSSHDAKSLDVEPTRSPNNLVFGYLNLFSDGVHNFTDGMALGSAFVLHGTVGGWSRTLFLLAHEIPQEVGDFGILVRSGFSVSEALFFNFLSALVALVGTAMALLVGQDPGQSSLMEGFTAGGFIYIAVAGVLAEMNNNGNSSLKSTAMQLTSLILGMSVALCISLYE